ncbi:hypothetical protein F4801DRAFT_559809 [Xylaria longipes]|nr:hypothetical protein F4801DRAFT_559809 [Xylaria longipes]
MRCVSPPRSRRCATVCLFIGTTIYHIIPVTFTRYLSTATSIITSQPAGPPPSTPLSDYTPIEVDNMLRTKGFMQAISRALRNVVLSWVLCFCLIFRSFIFASPIIREYDH